MIEQLKDICILYAEDDAGIRSQIEHFLRSRCARLILAENGREALERFGTEHPDIVISDILMPEMDGLEFASAVKAQSPGTPVILTTAFNDFEYLMRAIEIGIDAYVLKPVSLDRLQDALYRHAGILFNARNIAASRAQLEAYHHAAEEERQLVADLMQRMMRADRLADARVDYWLKPTDVVGGDLVAAARSHADRLYVMLADSTGHGLPAALNLLPVNHIFYSMVSKGLSVSLIVEEMNWAVKEQSPVERYVAALVACIDFRNRIVEVWNGGIPSAILVGADGAVVHSFDSVNLPLGILDRTFIAQTEIRQWDGDCQLFVYSDGIIEAEDEAGQAYGEARLKTEIGKAQPADRFDRLRGAVRAHMGQRHAFDDMTLLLVDCPSGDGG